MVSERASFFTEISRLRKASISAIFGQFRFVNLIERDPQTCNLKVTMIQILTAFRCELLTIAIVYESLKDAFGGPPALNSKVLRCAWTRRHPALRRAAQTISNATTIVINTVWCSGPHWTRNMLYAIKDMVQGPPEVSSAGRRGHPPAPTNLRLLASVYR